ncbi:MAG: hypothetical protein HG424_003005 [candidate division SR1 bacterium]|nr:hypothetical protein [candidate division SR1 bacterium]
MQELETLLNSLIQRGWKPFNYIGTAERIEVDDNFEIAIVFITGEFTYHTLRDLVVLESGLWQFVCDNKLYKQHNEKFRENVSKVSLNTGWFSHNYQYRLLESALIPEEELGEFLIDNIVVQGKN